MNPRTPAEALRYLAWNLYSCACLPYSEFTVATASAMADDLIAEAARLEALPPEELSEDDYEDIGMAAWPEASLQWAAAEAVRMVDDLRWAGFVIVRVKGGSND